MSQTPYTRPLRIQRPPQKLERSFGADALVFLLILVCICTPPVGWFILFMMSSQGTTGHPGLPGNPFYPAPQPVYFMPPPTGQPVMGLRAPVTAPERHRGHWTTQATLSLSQGLRTP